MILINNKSMKWLNILAKLSVVFALEDDPTILELGEICGNATYKCDFKTNLACIGPLVQKSGHANDDAISLCLPSDKCTNTTDFKEYSPAHGEFSGKTFVV